MPDARVARSVYMAGVHVLADNDRSLVDIVTTDIELPQKLKCPCKS